MTHTRIERLDERRARCHFRCPRKPNHECHVLLKPWPISDGKTWTWDGNETAPTLSPSINCSECGWHGHIQQGKLTDA